MDNELLSARSIWDHIKVTERRKVLRETFGATTTVARIFQYSELHALPLYLKKRVRRHAREARAVVKAANKATANRTYTVLGL